MKRSPIKRRTPLRAKSPMGRGKSIARGRVKSTVADPEKAAAPKRAKRVRARNPERRAAKHERNYAGPDGEHCRFIRSIPCAVRGRSMLPEHDCAGPIEDAHVVPRRMGGAGGCWADTVPLCRGHHREAGEWRTEARAGFERRYGVDLRQFADDLAQERLAAVARTWVADRPSVEAHDEAALFGWVKRRLALEVARVESPLVQAAPMGTLAVRVARALGLVEGEVPTGSEIWAALQLAEAAGWTG